MEDNSLAPAITAYILPEMQTKLHLDHKRAVNLFYVLIDVNSNELKKSEFAWQ